MKREDITRRIRLSGLRRAGQKPPDKVQGQQLLHRTLVHSRPSIIYRLRGTLWLRLPHASDVRAAQNGKPERFL